MCLEFSHTDVLKVAETVNLLIGRDAGKDAMRG